MERDQRPISRFNAVNERFFYRFSVHLKWLVSLGRYQPSIKRSADPTPALLLSGNYWNGAGSASDLWELYGNIANGTNGDSTFTFGHTGSPGATSVQVPGLSSLTRLVGALPAASTHATYQYWVSDSTTIVTEGQTCVGSSTGTALAISNGSIWKCF